MGNYKKRDCVFWKNEKNCMVKRLGIIKCWRCPMFLITDRNLKEKIAYLQFATVKLNSNRAVQISIFSLAVSIVVLALNILNLFNE